MAKKHHNTIVSCWVFVLIASLWDTKRHVCVDGEQTFNSNFGPTPKGTVKSIKVPEDGDVIDCVLVHKRHALDHGFIKDLQVNPELKNDNKYPEMYQNWHEYGECPQGTVPIRRTRNEDIHKKGEVVEYANVVMPDSGVYKGAVASISLWNPKVEAGEFSLAHVSVQSGNQYFGTFTSLEAGWIVYSERYHDSQSRLFIHWTSDNFRATGCFDLDCPGFVQVDPKFAVGVPIKPKSSYNSSTFESTFSIYKSRETGSWNFEFQGVLLGYWPASIVPLLRDHAEAVVWGGEIMNNVTNNHHTTTQMGNGQFSKINYGEEFNKKAAYICDLNVFNKDFVSEPASKLQTDDGNEYEAIKSTDEEVQVEKAVLFQPVITFTTTANVPTMNETTTEGTKEEIDHGLRNEGSMDVKQRGE